MATKRKKPLRNLALPSLETTSLRKGQEFTSKVWAKHRSEVIGKEGYSSVITRIPLGRCHFNHIACSAAMKVATEPNAKAATLFLPLSGAMAIRVDGKRFRADPEHPFYLPAELGMEFEATETECLMMEIPAEVVLAEARRQGISEREVHRTPTGWGDDGASLTRLLQFMSAELMSASAVPSPRYLRCLETLLLATLTLVLNSTHSDPGQSSDCQKIGTMKLETLRSWIEGNLTSEISSEVMAAKAGISIRAFQKAFLKHLHTTPGNYLRDLRLEAVRRELLQGRKVTSISEIALRYQFHHLGRFSQIYRQHFGELPTTTLTGRRKKAESGYPKKTETKGR